jgi:hypothetical protein
MKETDEEECYCETRDKCSTPSRCVFCKCFCVLKLHNANTFFFIYFPSYLFIVYTIMLSIRDSSVGTGKGYGLDDWGSNPGRGKIFLFFSAPKPALDPTQPYLKLVRGVKRPGREADH